MTPIYDLNSPPSPFPLVLNEDQHLQLYSPSPQASSSSSYLTSPLFFNSTQDQGGSYYRVPQHQQFQQEAEQYVSNRGSSDHQLLPSPSLPTVENGSNGLKLSICKQEDRNENQSDHNGSVKWMSSKMRLMRKMMNSDQMGTDKPVRSTQKFQNQQQLSSPFDTENRSNNSNNTIRVCSDCNTTKTPLWRSGPRGPKSLCNACGIRQRKARRAMAAAAASKNSTILASETSSLRTKVHHKVKRSDNSYMAQYKKRCKLAAPPHNRKKLCFEDFTISLSKNLAFHQVFPSDEKEAAILLMALSCGILCG